MQHITLRWLRHKFEQYCFAVILIISLNLYWGAPVVYSQTFCHTAFVLFLICAILLCHKVYLETRTFLSFDIIFTIAFLYTNYIYGVYLYTVNSDFSLFRLAFNENYICKATILSTVAYCSYALGRSYYFKSKSKHRADEKIVFNISRLESILKILLVIVLILLLPHIGSKYSGSIELGSLGLNLLNLSIIILYYILIVEFRRKTSPKTLIKNNFILLCLTFAVMAALSLMGSRTIPLRLMLIILFLYNKYIYRIPNRYLFLIGGFGFFLMYFIGATRFGYRVDSISDNMLIEVGNELIINNRSLFVLIEYADKYGYSYGISLLLNILSVIPFLQSIFLNLTGWSEADINSAYLVTDLYFKHRTDSVIGLGTNLVGDVYLCFGYIGVIVIFYLLGRLINKISNSDRFIHITILILFFMNAVYYTRSTLLTPIREIAWIYVIYRLTTKRYKSNSSKL